MRRSSPLVTDDEIGLRYAMIDPILRALGWNTALPWECRPNSRLGRLGPLDYVRYDHAGVPAVLIEVETRVSRRREHRIRLWRQTRGMTGCLAVLTYGWEWEIYDIGIRGREFAHKRVDRLALDPQGGRQPHDFRQGTVPLALQGPVVVIHLPTVRGRSCAASQRCALPQPVRR